MSARPSRAWLGNALVLLLLAAIGWALLRLHLGEAWWRGAPPARQSQIAVLATVLYALGNLARARAQPDRPQADRRAQQQQPHNRQQYFAVGRNVGNYLAKSTVW